MPIVSTPTHTKSQQPRVNIIMLLATPVSF